MAKAELEPAQANTGLLDNRELAHRRDHGIEVFLMWHKRANVLAIMLYDFSTNASYNFTVPNDRGLDAFYHPFAYLRSENDAA